MKLLCNIKKIGRCFRFLLPPWKIWTLNASPRKFIICNNRILCRRSNWNVLLWKKERKKNRFRVCAANHQGVSKTGALSIWPLNCKTLYLTCSRNLHLGVIQLLCGPSFTKLWPLPLSSGQLWSFYMIPSLFQCPWFLIRKAIWYVSNCRILRNIYLFSSSCVCPVGCLSFE